MTTPTTFPIPLDQAGAFASDEAIRRLSQREWQSWLIERTQEFDTFTGQHLSGVADRYGLVLSSVRRVTDEATYARFFDALFVLITERLALFSSHDDQHVDQAQTLQLRLMLRLLRQFRSREIAAFIAPQRLAEVMQQFVLQTQERNTTSIADSARLEAIELLSRMTIYFGQRYDALLDNPNLNIAVLSAFVRQGSTDLPDKICRTYKTLKRRKRTSIFNSFLHSITNQIKNSEIQVTLAQLRELLIAAREQMHGDLYMEFGDEVQVETLIGRSTVLEALAAANEIRVVRTSYPSDWKKYEDELFGYLLRSIQETLEKPYRVAETPVKGNWDFQVRLIARGEAICLSTIFLTRERAFDDLSVVPFAYVPTVNMVYLQHSGTPEASGRFRLIRGTLKDIKEVHAEDKPDERVEFGTMAGTAADEELQACWLEAALPGLHDRASSLADLGDWLLAYNIDDKPFLRAAIVDSGYTRDLTEYVEEKLPLQFWRRSYSGISVVDRPVPYRHPPLAGFAIPKNDLSWAALVKRAVDKILFNTHRIQDERSPAAKILNSAGILPLTVELMKQPPSTWWCAVPKYLIPATLLSEDASSQRQASALVSGQPSAPIIPLARRKKSTT